MTRRVFALIPARKGVISGGDLLHLCEPLRKNARHCAGAWGLTPPDVALVDREDKLPGFCSPILMSDGEGDPGALAVHFYDQYRRSPAAIVYVNRASGLREGDFSVCEAIAHEICEAIVNEDLSAWPAHPTRPGVQVAREACDPLQSTYEVESRGTRWPVANFVTPAWFKAGPHEAATFFDFAGELMAPGQIWPTGYVILRRREADGWHVWLEGPTGERFGSAPTKAASTGRGVLAWQRVRA